MPWPSCISVFGLWANELSVPPASNSSWVLCSVLLMGTVARCPTVCLKFFYYKKIRKQSLLIYDNTTKILGLGPWRNCMTRMRYPIRIAKLQLIRVNSFAIPIFGAVPHLSMCHRNPVKGWSRKREGVIWIPTMSAKGPDPVKGFYQRSCWSRRSHGTEASFLRIETDRIHVELDLDITFTDETVFYSSRVSLKSTTSKTD